MRFSGRTLFIFLLLVIVGGSSVAFIFAWRLRNALEQNFASKLQADLIDIQLMEKTHNEPVKILLVGDIMLSRQVGDVMEARDDYSYPFREVAGELSSADITFGNLEGPISSRGEDMGSEYSFRANPKAIEGLNFAGFDVLSIANNHIWDWGKTALLDTIALLSNNGIFAVGAGKDYEEANKSAVINIKGTSVAFLAYTNLYPENLEAREWGPGISNLDEAETKIASLNEIADVVVVSMHWGEEYEKEATEAQRELAYRLIDAGADLVVGHHPHVIEETEQYKDGWILYSLGNFVFDQNFSEETKTGEVATVTVKNRKISGVDMRKYRISATFQPTFINL